MLERSTSLSLLASLFVGLATLGCVDPDGDYEEFRDREAKTEPFIPDAGGDGGALCDPALETAACDAPTVADTEGQWLFALSTPLGPTKPILFFADIVVTESGGGIEWTWTIRPLDAATREPLAALPELPPSTVPASGDWSVDLPILAVPGAANPISGSDVEADTELTGKVCGGREFLCGDATGAVTKLGGNPTNIPITGSTWTLSRLETPDTAPETVFVSCKCAQAAPPG
jgi:hypothetical protein